MMIERNQQRLVLGVDGGGSKIDVVLMNQDRLVVAQSQSLQGVNYHLVGLETAVERLVHTIKLLIASANLAEPVVLDAAVLGLAGCNFPAEERRVLEALRTSSLSHLLGARVEVVNDAAVALRAGTKHNIGVVLISGTGSNCLGRNAQGEKARSGGVDYILADEGSGYDIGLRTLRAVVQSMDGRAGETKLCQALLHHLRVTSLEALYNIVYAEYTTKPRIAALATLASQAAEDGDQAAQDILTHSVNELVKMVDAVVHRLAMIDQSFDVVAIGSVFREQQYFTHRLNDELKRIAPQARLVRPNVSAAVGAAWLALEGDSNVSKS
jgi:N-acetylglucosamine kinase-like BadF-type ATPase